MISNRSSNRKLCLFWRIFYRACLQAKKKTFLIAIQCAVSFIVEEVQMEFFFKMRNCTLNEDAKLINRNAMKLSFDQTIRYFSHKCITNIVLFIIPFFIFLIFFLKFYFPFNSWLCIILLSSPHIFCLIFIFLLSLYHYKFILLTLYWFSWLRWIKGFFFERLTLKRCWNKSLIVFFSESKICGAKKYKHKLL